MSNWLEWFIMADNDAREERRVKNWEEREEQIKREMAEAEAELSCL